MALSTSIYDCEQLSVSDDEQKYLIEFRKRIVDINLDEVESDEMHLIKWLRARNYDIDRSEKMIRRSMEWRASFDFDNIVSWKPPANYDVYFPYQLSGYDESGCPVIIIPVCEWDIYVRKELAEGRKELVHRFINQITGKVTEDIKNKFKDGKKISQIVMIFDIFGFNIRHLTSIAVPEVLLESFRNFERNFPESLKVAYVINAPSLFALLFPLVKKMLSAKTTGKVQLFDGNCIKWKKALLSTIPQKSLPIHYGGTQPDLLQKKIEAAKLVVDHGGIGVSGISLDALNTVVVGAGSNFLLNYDIKEPNIKISWIFKTDGHDIGFCILLNGSEVVPKRRINSQIIVCEGNYVCSKIGNYVITFDNTYSLFRAKTLHYLITIEDSRYDSELIENAKTVN